MTSLAVLVSMQIRIVGLVTHNALVGSSSGSAVAVSTNIVPLSFGTETDTSIIGPASINGVVGFKPTVGFTSRNGVIPISENMDSVGPFGRTVADVVHGLNAIMGIDERDRFTQSSSRPPEVDFSKWLSTKESLNGAKFGLPDKRCWELVPEDRKAVASKVFEAIREAGGEVLTTDFPCAEERIPPDGSWDWLGHTFFRACSLLTALGPMVNHHSLSSQWLTSMPIMVSTLTYQSFLIRASSPWRT